MTDQSYSIEADVSIDGGAWWPNRMAVSTNKAGLPSKREAAFELKREVSLRATKGDWRRIHVRHVKVWEER